jgi:hypothetical protein
MLKRLSILLTAAASVWAAEPGTLDPAHWTIGGAAIDVEFTPGRFDLPRAAVLKWVENAARSVTVYFGRFPVPHARIRITPYAGSSGVFNGTTWGHEGSLTRVSLGEHTSQDQLDTDWMMTHELVHTGFPDVDNQHHWMEEGMATYVEPIARAQAGLIDIKRVWSEMARFMPKGQPAAYDQGLDRTHSWGRTYWGGALFCLLADVQIREQTQNRKGLQDALRAIVAAGGNIDEEWPIRHAFEVGDKATGTRVLVTLYDQMKETPITADLDTLWKRLGVELAGNAVSFNDKAPLAAVRRAITKPVLSEPRP